MTAIVFFTLSSLRVIETKSNCDSVPGRAQTRYREACSAQDCHSCGSVEGVCNSHFPREPGFGSGRMLPARPGRLEHLSPRVAEQSNRREISTLRVSSPLASYF